MKLYLIIILFSIFVLIAVAFYVFYLMRYRLYKDLCFICGKLSTNINFNKKTIGDILSETYSKVSFLTKCFIINNEIYNKLLPKDRVKFIKEFFSSLGQGDVDFELSNISYFETEFTSLTSEAKEELQKKGSMYLKLIIGLGLIICIILI